MKQELIKTIVRVGNSAGVILPKDWVGGVARVELIRKPLNISGDVLGLLSDYLPSILGVYLVGSYARNEQTEDSDVDVIAISEGLRKSIVSDKYHIEIYSLQSIEKTIEKNPLMIYPRIAESKAIFNKSLIGEFSKKFDKKSFRRFIDETKSILKIDRKIIDLDGEIGGILSSPEVVYSLMLRLRGLFLVDCLISNKVYRKKDFFAKFNKEIGGEEFGELYKIYEKIKNRKKVDTKIRILVVEKLFSSVEESIKNYGK
ncbi:MAG: DUF2080 family transposase-associated protein [Nanoarchaeota archaeon]|nr:DUF2080 family transposase-associated protein [Nanoarchaeota archaeon]